NLESDATIQYARALEGLERVSDPTQLSTAFESPYNTYSVRGLPPGAICSPGLDAILATVYPSPPMNEKEEEIDAYYFVSNNAGKTYYAHSLSQHEKNKETVRKENEAAAAAAESGDEG
ncbi:MAG: endolytic transglycosylase MltG, partial [Clostridia bacterium]|nr:endolytic transglycosylase MltG [Clostridia bacterium]